MSNLPKQCGIRDNEYTKYFQRIVKHQSNKSRRIHEALSDLSQSCHESVSELSQSGPEARSNATRTRPEQDSYLTRTTCKFSRRVMKQNRVFCLISRTIFSFSRRNNTFSDQKWPLRVIKRFFLNFLISRRKIKPSVKF